MTKKINSTLKEILIGCVIWIVILPFAYFIANEIEGRNKKHKEADSIYDNTIKILENTNKTLDSIYKNLDSISYKIDKYEKN